MRTQPRRDRNAALVLVAALSAACGGGGTAPPPAGDCSEETPVEPVQTIDALVRGSVSVVDRADHTLDDDGQPRAATTGRFTGTFADFTTVTSTPSDLVAVGATCVGLVSRPVSSGPPRRLDLASLVVRGTAAGELGATRTSTGVFAKTTTARLLEGASTLTIVGAAIAGGFPAFDQGIDAVATLELLAPVAAPAAEAELLLVDDVSIEWTPGPAGSGAWIDVTILPEQAEGASGGGQVTCRVRDDGCFVLPASASAFLLASQAPRYTVSVARRRAISVAPATGASLDVEVASEVRVSLVNGVLGR
ncbi:hypothetical protein L6R52_37810 [Myxococcota bacterium]|nr:hypothetical protein [Myxococcota bacterium]